jgi:hypothetical protein
MIGQEKAPSSIREYANPVDVVLSRLYHDYLPPDDSSPACRHPHALIPCCSLAVAGYDVCGCSASESCTTCTKTLARISHGGRAHRGVGVVKVSVAADT